MATVLTVAFVTVRAGTVSAGAATAAVLYFHRLFDVAGGLLGVLDTSQVAGAALARLVGVTQLPACPAASVGATVPSEPDLELRGVHFAYEAGHDVLHGIDLVVAAGERLALVGTSGAGKTTIGRLVAGVHRPDGGPSAPARPGAARSSRRSSRSSASSRSAEPASGACLS